MGWERKVCGLGMGWGWIRRGREMGGGEWEACEGEEYFILM